MIFYVKFTPFYFLFDSDNQEKSDITYNTFTSHVPNSYSIIFNFFPDYHPQYNFQK